MEVPRPTLEILERTRRGEVLEPADVVALINAWSVGAASDAQMSAWCATAGISGVPADIASSLSTALLGGGDRLELGSLGPTADIRSAGGVGDSALVFAASATAASLGVIVASTGTRGISHVSGILDALEAIPGMRPELTLEEYVLQARDFGIVIAEAGDTLVPGERRLADLRESTATAEGDVLVAVSAAVRAISGGAGHIIVEVPSGRGSLLPDADHAVIAGDLVTRITAEWHRGATVFPVARVEPLAGVAGHALEMAAAFDVLRGEGDAHLLARVIALAGAAAEATGVAEDGAAAASASIADGRARATAERWITAQGGDAAVIDDPGGLAQPLIVREFTAARAGRVVRVDAGAVGTTTRWLGAGRLDPDQVIDPAVGVRSLVAAGSRVEEGEVVGEIHASDDWLAGRAEDLLADAWVIVDD